MSSTPWMLSVSSCHCLTSHILCTHQFTVQGINVTSLREIKLLREIHSPYIVELLDVISQKRKVNMVSSRADPSGKQLYAGYLPCCNSTLASLQCKGSCLLCSWREALGRPSVCRNLMCCNRCAQVCAICLTMVSPSVSAAPCAGVAML